MAIYHLSVKLIGRSRGRSATAAAAYRAGTRIIDRRTGAVFDYSRRQHVAWRAIAAPNDAADWVWNREKLWNAAELAEKRRDAQIAREIEIALPRELDLAARQQLIAEFVEAEFTVHGMVSDIAIHDNPGNPHCHILLSLRNLRPDGFGTKVREWNDKTLLVNWRESWATHCNRALARNGNSQRIDHRTLVAQGASHRFAIRHVSLLEKARLRRALTKRRGNINKSGGVNMEGKQEQPNESQKSDPAPPEKKSSVFSGGISTADYRQVQAGREEISSLDYQQRVAEHFGDRIYGVQYYDEHHSLHVRIKGGSLRDFGDRIVPKFGGVSDEVKAMVELAKLKGWEKINISGSEHLRGSLWREAISKGFSPEAIVGYTPNAGDLATLSASKAVGCEGDELMPDRPLLAKRSRPGR